MPAIKAPKQSVAASMYALAAERKARLIKNLIASEEGREIDPQEIIDDATACGIPFSEVAAAGEVLHARRMRLEEFTAADWQGKFQEALAESRAAQQAVPAALAAFEEARRVYQAANQRATAAVTHASQADESRKNAERRFCDEMRSDAGSGGDVNDWKNIAL